ncbi:PREDICTED: uncharacterized protein LOC109472382 isoform X5 [Branchiostoma belcheri]|uniref:Uncharacterized protein LOC109472382 isoform X5 n=1 Tax=Branchiostoma belcheri TaxID=7741 RepID=A0A6P4Z158_BRABE|nr:PREDICTED: uncharacterized protein LOC109472382 isoform X5 [Branchiostoma belcheri]
MPTTVITTPKTTDESTLMTTPPATLLTTDQSTLVTTQPTTLSTTRRTTKPTTTVTMQSTLSTSHKTTMPTTVLTTQRTTDESTLVTTPPATVSTTLGTTQGPTSRQTTLSTSYKTTMPTTVITTHKTTDESTLMTTPPATVSTTLGTTQGPTSRQTTLSTSYKTTMPTTVITTHKTTDESTLMTTPPATVSTTLGTTQGPTSRQTTLTTSYKTTMPTTVITTHKTTDESTLMTTPPATVSTTLGTTQGPTSRQTTLSTSYKTTMPTTLITTHKTTDESTLMTTPPATLLTTDKSTLVTTQSTTLSTTRRTTKPTTTVTMQTTFSTSHKTTMPPTVLTTQRTTDESTLVTTPPTTVSTTLGTTQGPTSTQTTLSTTERTTKPTTVLTTQSTTQKSTLVTTQYSTLSTTRRTTQTPTTRQTTLSTSYKTTMPTTLITTHKTTDESTLMTTPPATLLTTDKSTLVTTQLTTLSTTRRTTKPTTTVTMQTTLSTSHKTTMPTTVLTTQRTTDESTLVTTPPTTVSTTLGTTQGPTSTQTTLSTTERTTKPTTVLTTQSTTHKSTLVTSQSSTLSTTRRTTQTPTTRQTTLSTSYKTTMPTTLITTHKTTDESIPMTTQPTTFLTTDNSTLVTTQPITLSTTLRTTKPTTTMQSTLSTSHKTTMPTTVLTTQRTTDESTLVTTPPTTVSTTLGTTQGPTSTQTTLSTTERTTNPTTVLTTQSTTQKSTLVTTQSSTLSTTPRTTQHPTMMTKVQRTTDIDFPDVCDPNPCHNGGTCTERGNSYNCKCLPGYAGRNCEKDIDSCSAKPCHAQATCKDNPAPALDATCTCRRGYAGDGLLNGNGCSDIDGCSANPCDENATCTDNPAPALDATCSCTTGYTGDGYGNGTGCSDTDGCSPNPCDKNATCIDNPAPALDATCSCNTGYTGDGLVSGTGCSDIDGCSASPCDENAICTDNPAPALDANCNCRTGYTGNGFVHGTGCSDIDACLANPCDKNATCTDNPAPALGANCTCNTGYTGDGLVSGTGCSDIDACLDDPCDAEATCTDNPAPALNATCTCTTGYTGDGYVNGTECSDVDACLANPCHVQATCTDNPAPALDATCTCNTGYTGDGYVNGTGCSDTDGCSPNPCDKNATCTDNPAPALDATCTCNTGYAGDGLVSGTGCSDIDGCSPNPCDENAICTDNPAPALDANCTCRTGYTGDGFVNGTGCLDIDACLANPCDQNATCTDNPAPALDATCSCNTGYTGDGLVSGTGCSDIDACLDDPCDAEATCTDNPAPALNATCTCTTGYTGDGYVNGTGCSDTDGCSSNPCDKNATCTDNPAPALDATCSCSTGYTGDGLVSGTGCSDICDPNPCENGGTCTKRGNSYNCKCSPGYAGRNCEKDIDACSAKPCHVQATCKDKPAPAIDATCTCKSGYLGDGLVNGTGCSDINECESNPCQNGGTCTDMVNGYDCRCTQEYGGPNCDIEKERCMSTPGRPMARCHVNGYCNGQRCICNDGYRGNGTYCSKVVTHHFQCRFPTIVFRIDLLSITSPYFIRVRRIVFKPFDIAIRARSLYVKHDHDDDGHHDNYDLGVETMRVLRFRPGSVLTVYEVNLTEHTIPELELLIRNQTAGNMIGNLSIQSNYTVFGKEAEVRCHCEHEENTKCVERNSNWICDCLEGYNRTNGTCKDIDECALRLDDCGDDSVCVNTKGSYLCFCTPIVNIFGGGRTIQRSDDFQLNSVIEYSTSNCQVGSIRRISYNWTLHSTDRIKLSGTSLNQADIKVQQNQLAIGKITFYLTVRVVAEKNNTEVVHSSLSSTTINIITSPLVAGILGGSRRQIDHGNLTLDAATLSFDPDERLGPCDLTYTWNCTVLTVRGEYRCPDISAPECGEVRILVNREFFTRVFNFTLTVSAPRRTPAHASQVIEVVSATRINQIPGPQIICEELHGTCGPIINVGEQMKLVSVCGNCDHQSGSYEYWWTLVASPTDYPEWTDSDYDNNLLNERDQDYLVMKANIFDKPGDYVMRVNITDVQTGLTGYAEYTFRTNGPPTKGTCNVMPPIGTASVDDFKICCEGFNDPDQPLTYNFLYETDIDIASVNTTSSSVFHLLYTGPENCTVPLKLPLGLRSRNYSLPIRVQVLDKFGGSVSVEPDPPTVKPAEISSIQMLTNNTTTVQDVQKTTAVISSAASVLNEQTIIAENTTQERIMIRETLTSIVQQVEVTTIEHAQQVLSTLEHITAVPEELENNAQVDASTTLQDISVWVKEESTESGTEELEVLSAHMLTVAVNVLNASNIKAIETKKRNVIENITTETDNLEKNKNATTQVLKTINTFGTLLLSRKTRDDKPTLLKSKGFVLSLANTSCDKLAERIIRTEEQIGAFFYLPEKAAQKIGCLNKLNESVGSKTFWTQQNPHGYSPNADDVRTGVQALSFERRNGVRVRELEDLQNDARIQLITTRTDQENDITISGTTQPENSGNITVHNFNISKARTSLHIILQTQNDSAPLRLFLQRGTDASPDRYTWNMSLPFAPTSPAWSTRLSVTSDPYTWFLSQEELNITEEDTSWSLAAQHVPILNDTGGNLTAKYNITIISARCLFFDENEHLWADRGCKVGPLTTRDHLHCLCNHLTSFGFFVAPNELNIRAALLKIPEDITTNFIVWATVGTAFLLYFVLLFWARGRDLREKRKLRGLQGNIARATSYHHLLEYHLWASVVRPSSRSIFTRAQRVSCCFSLLMLVMVTNIMFFQQGRADNSVSIGGVNIPFNISLQTVILGLTCTLIAFPPNVVIVLIFRNLSVRKKRTSQLDNIVQLRAYREFGEMYNTRRKTPLCFDAKGCSSDTVSTSSRLEHDGRGPGYIDHKTGVTQQDVTQEDGCLPWWFLFIAWFLVFAIVLLSALFTLLYGVQYGRRKAEAWLFSFLVSFLTDILIVQPLKVVLIVIFVRLICKNRTRRSKSQHRNALLQWTKLPRVKLKDKLGSRRLADQIRELDERYSADPSIPSLPTTPSSLITDDTDELGTIVSSSEDGGPPSYLHLAESPDTSSDPYPSEYAQSEAWAPVDGGDGVHPLHDEDDLDSTDDDNDSRTMPFREVSFKLP